MNVSSPAPSHSSQFLQDLGRALRWLRERQSKKQYLVADSAGVTKGMLSAYETGRQRPSLDTLEKLLSALGCDLNDLHNALQVVTERPERICSPRRTLSSTSRLSSLDQPSEVAERGYFDVLAVLGLSDPVPIDQREALEQILAGCHRLVRNLYKSLDRALVISAQGEPFDL